MEIITGYTGKPHVTSEQDRDVNIGVVGEGSYVLQDWNAVGSRGIFQQ